MATWPANGATDWNTTALAYLAVEHNTDGTHKAATGGINGYVTFDGTDASIKGTGLNITSVVRNSAGVYTITWDTDFSDANYTVVASAFNASGATRIAGPNTYLAGSVKIEVVNTAGTKSDAAIINVIAIGS